MYLSPFKNLFYVQQASKQNKMRIKWIQVDGNTSKQKKFMDEEKEKQITTKTELRDCVKM